jgi:hypothetical protein
MRFLAATIFYLTYYITSALALGSQCNGPLGNGTAAAHHPYWLQSMPHNGKAAFNPSPSNYTVFRNVKDYGAVGDGVTDDTKVRFSSDVWRISHVPSFHRQSMLLSPVRPFALWEYRDPIFDSPKPVWSRVQIKHDHPCFDIFSLRKLSRHFSYHP